MGPPLTPDPGSQGGEGGIAYRFLLTWIATYLIFFTLAATKLPNYILPVVVPCALLTANFLECWRRGEVGLATPHWIIALFGLVLLGAGLTTTLVLASGVVDFAPLRGRHIAGLDALAWIGAVPIAGGLIGWRLWRRQRRDALIACVTVTALALVAPLAVLGTTVADRIKAPRHLVAQAGARQPEVDLRIGAWQLPHLPSLNFYAQRDVMILQSEADLRGLLQYPLPVVVFLPAAAWEACDPETRLLGREVTRQPDLQRHGDVVAVANRLMEAQRGSGPKVAGRRVAP